MGLHSWGLPGRWWTVEGQGEGVIDLVPRIIICFYGIKMTDSKHLEVFPFIQATVF